MDQNNIDILDNWEEIDDEKLNCKLEQIKAAIVNKPQSSDRKNNGNIINANGIICGGGGAVVVVNGGRGSGNRVDECNSNRSNGSSSTTTEDNNNNIDLNHCINNINAFHCSESMKFYAMGNEDENRMQQSYVTREPTVKILKRPTTSDVNGGIGGGAAQNMNYGNGGQTNGGIKPKAPIKTLKQREEEYAQARLRILGSATSPDEAEEQQQNVNINKNNDGYPNIQRKYPNVNDQQQQQQQSPIRNISNRNNDNNTVGLGTTSFDIPLSPNGNLKDCVLRLPYGPDGTNGFRMKR